MKGSLTMKTANHKVKLFFDESGKDNDRPTLMGGLLIPSMIYDTDVFKIYNNKLENKELKIHWSSFKGSNDEKQIITPVINDLMKFKDLIDLSIINYAKPELINKDSFNDMIYNKLPERLFYGLLRNHGFDTKIDAELYMEKATEYKELYSDIKKQMNRHAIYRNQPFKVLDSFDVPKQNQIGVELVDLILGIVRTIIKNNNKSGTSRKRNSLVVESLKIESFYSFLCNMNYFEWTNNSKLIPIHFEKYLKAFLSNQEDWIKFKSESE